MIVEPLTESVILHESPQTESEVVIQVRNVGKMYRIYEKPADRLKQMLLWRYGKSYGQEFWAVRNLSFEVRKGETVGIIGRNGSGKSTLLQIIAGTLAPTEGDVEVRGRVAALLELGSGFNPEFTGRENVFLNGAILGISREEMNRRFDEIVAFADIGKFLEQPVKTYSSGMVVRLAFAVQAMVEPEILIIDEALAVGDLYFQTKCMSKIAELRQKGTSILFVSHSLGTVKILCTRAILIDHGELLMAGHPDPVCDRYYTMMMNHGVPMDKEDIPVVPDAQSSKLQPLFDKRITDRFGNGAARYVECQVLQDGREVSNLVHGKDCEIHALLQFVRGVDEWGEVGLVVRTIDGVELFAVNSYLLRQEFAPQEAGQVVRVVFRFRVSMAPGIYNVVLGYRAPAQGDYIDKVFNAVAFTVEAADSFPVPFLFTVNGEISYRRLEKDELK